MVVPLEIWDMRGSWAETAEEIAAECAHVTVEDVETWLRRGGDPNDVIQLRDGHPLQPWPFLKEIAGRGRIDLMELLLSYGADINGSDPNNGVTPLLSAIYMGSLREVEFLLAKGAEFVGYELHCGGAPYGHNDILRTLLRAGADITETEYGRTAEEDAAMESGYQSDGEGNRWPEDMVEKHAILRGVRIAGSYKRWALQPHYSLLVLLSLCHRRRAAPTASTPSYVARLFGAAPSDREGGDAESSDSSDDDQDRAVKAARATGSTTIPDVAVFQVLAFWLGDAKTL